MEKIVVVCTDRECRHLHDHKLLNGIRICERLDILEDVACKVN